MFKKTFSSKFSSVTIDSHVGLIMNLLLKLVNKSSICYLKFRNIRTSYICKDIIKSKSKFRGEKALNLSCNHKSSFHDYILPLISEILKCIRTTGIGNLCLLYW